MVDLQANQLLLVLPMLALQVLLLVALPALLLLLPLLLVLPWPAIPAAVAAACRYHDDQHERSQALPPPHRMIAKPCMPRPWIP